MDEDDVGDDDRTVRDSEMNHKSDLLHSPTVPLTEDETAGEAVDPSVGPQNRRRASVSISVFGQVRSTNLYALELV